MADRFVCASRAVRRGASAGCHRIRPHRDGPHCPSLSRVAKRVHASAERRHGAVHANGSSRNVRDGGLKRSPGDGPPAQVFPGGGLGVRQGGASGNRYGPRTDRHVGDDHRAQAAVRVASRPHLEGLDPGDGRNPALPGDAQHFLDAGANANRNAGDRHSKPVGHPGVWKRPRDHRTQRGADRAGGVQDPWNAERVCRALCRRVFHRFRGRSRKGRALRAPSG